nr:retrovirus-related Pol polyprotein from transposon TNT 1-94 [Tanacetum cinerariifolium]
MLYDSNVIAKETNVISIADFKETLMLEAESRSKMLLIQSDPMVLEKKFNTKPINYAELNRLFEDFGKRFVLQQELCDQQASCPITDQYSSSPVKIEAPREIPTKHFLIENDRLLDQIISQDIVNIVVNSSMDVNISMKVNSSVVMNDSVNYVKMYNKCLELEAELIKQHNMVEKDEYNRLSKRFSKLEQHSLENDLRKVKRKDIVANDAQMSNVATIALGIYMLDPIILAPKVKNNRKAHEYYLKHTIEQAAIFREAIKQAKSQNPLDSASYSTCMYVKLIQELLGVNPSTSASRPKPSGNTKNDRISQTPSSNAKNKVEVKSRKIKSKVNKQNSNSKSICNEHVKHPVKVAAKHVVTRVYTRRPKVLKSIQNSKPKVLKSTAKRMEPDTSRGSDTSVAPSSSSLNDCRHNIVCGLPRLKFEKDHFCSACAMGKSKKKSHKPKSEDTNQEKLYLLYMDLCRPMRVTSVNGKKYILVIVDDYTRFTWVKFLASKDEAPDFIIKFLKMIQVRLNATARNIRTDNGTEFINQNLRDYYEQVGISHETSVVRTLQQNGFVERRNRTLVEATRTMLIFAQAPLFLWAEAIATTSYLYVFGARCYPNNDSENLGKLQAKVDIGIFIGYAPKKKAYRIYNRRTRKIIKTIYVDFDELMTMASEQLGSRPRLQCMTPATPSSGLVPNPPPLVPLVPPSRHEWDLVFQPMFDEFFSPPASVASLVLVEEASAPIESTGSSSSTTINQDAPSPSTSQTTPQSQSQTNNISAEEESHDHEVAHMCNNPYFSIPIPETVSEESSSSDVISTTVHSDTPISEHLSKWTKDHSLQNIIGDPSRPISKRLQLHEQAMFCYCDAFLTLVEPKTYKDALTRS